MFVVDASDFHRGAELFRFFSHDFDDFVQEQCREDAESLSEDIKELVYKGYSKWAPLSPAWLRTKELRNWDSRIYLATGALMSHITFGELDSSAKSVTYWVGADEEQVKGESITYRQLLYALENGRYVKPFGPARPLLAPALAEYKKGVPHVWSERIKAMVYRRTI